MKGEKRVPALRFPDFTKEWENRRYDEIYSFYSTNSFSRDNLNYEDGKVMNIHYGDIHTKFSALFDIEKEIVPYVNSDIDLNKIKEDNYLKVGDLLIADASEDYNDIGKTIEVTNLNNEKVISGLHTFHARPIKYKMQLGFAAHMLQTWFVRKQVMKIAQGTKVLGLATSRLGQIQLLLPTLLEQQKIASFLSAVDKKIEQLAQKKHLLEDYKKGVMQQLFSQQLRFKDEHGKEYRDWEEKKISNLFTVTRGKVLSATKTKESVDLEFRYPVYSSQTKNNGLMGYYDNYLFENAITWTTDGANAGDVNFREGRFYCTNVCGVLLSDKGYANQMIAEKLNTITKRHVSYVGNPKLMNNVMSMIRLSIPSDKNEQIKIANFLSAIDKKIEIVNTQIEHTQQFKKGLLQQMFV